MIFFKIGWFDLPWWLRDKEPAGEAGDLDSVPGLSRSPGGGRGNPLQYSCLENPMDRGAWQATVHGIAKNWTTLNDEAQHSTALFKHSS